MVHKYQQHCQHVDYHYSPITQIKQYAIYFIF
jgi:hypothetical protein